jgi:1-acyl-sn-glycerol-3-phosphate acyltransferase
MVGVVNLVATTWELLGLAVLLPLTCVSCFAVRIVAGHVVAKRVHEYVLGYGIFYWMRAIGMWSLEVRGKVPSDKKPYVVIANHASYMDHSLLSFVPIRKKYLTNAKYFMLPVITTN